jgi:hypothetical protein
VEAAGQIPAAAAAEMDLLVRVELWPVRVGQVSSS